MGWYYTGFGVAPGRGHPPSPAKIHKIDKIVRLKDRSIIPSVRFSTVERVDIGIPLKNNLTSYSFSSVFSELIYIFVCSILPAGPRDSALSNKIVLSLDKNFL